MVPAAVAGWIQVIQLLIPLGVKSWETVRNLMQDAGADDATIKALEPKWDALVSDIQRASQGPS